MNPKSTPKKSVETREKSSNYASDIGNLKDLAVEVTDPNKVQDEYLGEVPEYAYTKNITKIEGGNLLGGAPGRLSRAKGRRTVESTIKAVKKIHETFHPKTVITFEKPSDCKGDSSTIEAEIRTWQELGVEVIHAPVEEDNIVKLFGLNRPGKPKSKGFEIIEALNKGQCFIHCTYGMHRARALVEIWRGSKGIDRQDALDDNKRFEKYGHARCKKQAKEIIAMYLRNQDENQSKLPYQIREEKLPKYVNSFTRIEGGNYRGGMPGQKGMTKPTSPEQIEKSVDKLTSLEPKIKTVIILNGNKQEGITTAEINAWRSHQIKVIYMPSGTSTFKDFEKKYPKKMWKAFKALNEGGAFVHCRHGSHRAVAFVELWRATRGIDRTKAMKDNPNYNGRQWEIRDNTINLIPRYLANSRGETIGTLRTIEETPAETAAKMTLIGDSIGKGISATGIKIISSKHKVVAIGGARLTGSISKSQFDKIDPQKTPYLVIQGGTNDLHKKATPQQVAENLKTLYKKAKAKGFKKIRVVTIPPHTDSQLPEKVLQTNKILREMAQNGEIELYDLYADYIQKDPTLTGIRKNNVHPNSKGYKILGELLVNHMKGTTTTTSPLYAGEVGGSLLPGTGYETIPAPTEHQSKLSQKLQKTLLAEIEKIDEATRAKDKTTIESSSIKDIRFNTGLLNGNADKVQKEMHRRLAQYTTSQTDGSLLLDYNKFGYNHEMGIGLGDILPPQYQRVIILTASGQYRIGQRGLVNTSSESNRVGYKDEATGSYLATFTGDRIYVLDPPLTDKTKLAELLAREKEAREGGKSTYYETSSNGFGSSFDNEYSTAGGNQLTSNGKIITLNESNNRKKNRGINLYNKHITEAQRKGDKFWNYGPEIAAGLWEYSPNEGENLWNFGKAYCKKIGIGEAMVNMIWGTFAAESGFNPFCLGSSVLGLGQPKTSSWQDSMGAIMKEQSKGNPFTKRILAGQFGKGVEYDHKAGNRKIRLENLGQRPYNPKKPHLSYSRCNPFIQMMHAAHWIQTALNKYRKNGIVLNELPLYEKLRYIYFATHEGPSGAIRYVRMLKTLEKKGADIKVIPGARNRPLNMAKMARAQVILKQGLDNKDPEIMAAFNQLAGKNKYDSQKGRCFSDQKRFLRTWYNTSRAAADTAYAGMTETTQQVTQGSPQQPAQISAETPQIRIPKIDITKFPGKTAILVLGNGPHPERNKYRARVAGDISHKMREVGLRPQLIFSGGKTGNRTISEAQEQYNHLASNPKYSHLLTEKENPAAVENKATSTASNISKTVDHLQKKGFQNVIVVSHEPGRGKNHGRRGATRLSKKIKNMNITYWEPETPDINRNFI
jgi:lysophospholipase L1-like esterase